METKVCKKCGKELPISEFYVHKKMSDGYLNSCKDCVIIRVNKYRKDNIEKIREYDRNRPNYKERREKEQKAIRADEKRAEKCREQKREWAKRNINKRNAHNKLYRAIKKGKITRLEYCQLCGKTNCKIQGHHYDYNKPLEVIWVCTECHGNLHKTYKNAHSVLGFDINLKKL